MRIGQNPAKEVAGVAKPNKITVTVVTHIPFLGGYYAQGLEILKLCLQSLREHADLPFDLMVFDNASCDEVRDYLVNEQKEDRIQYLVLSDKNIGKIGAWNYMFLAAPGEYVVFTDSDVYFYPNWLSPQVEALEVFPNVGMVTGLPLLTPEIYSSATVTWAQKQKDVKIERGNLLPWEDVWSHAKTLGGEEEVGRKFYDENESVRLTYKEIKYYVGAGHFQFLSRKNVLQEIFPIPTTRPLGGDRVLDETINEKGYLRLTTDKWYVKHLGNTMPDDVLAVQEAHRKKGEYRSLANIKIVRKLLRWVHDQSFKLMYRS